MIKLVKENLLYMAWITAVVSMVGSLYFSDVLGLVPCSPFLFFRKNLFFSSFFFFFLFFFYQNLLYYNLISEQLTPCTFGISCVARYISLLGFIDIPLLAFFAFVIITATLFIHKKHVY